ncbi:hypothetical protein LJR219_001233 [Phenylobacterium sp. LjRoot219]|uniref:hypothetical protein n=1 Tax=Phenylobacterium sp. LjRoot219 TaxID=3342283 RepID=UPI003ECEE2AD
MRALSPLALFLTLSAAAPAVAQSAAEGRWHAWTGGKTADAFQIGDISLRFRQEVGPGDLLTPVAVIEKNGVSETLRGETAGSFGAGANFGVFRLDAARTPILLFRSWSGGAHCCFAYLAATPTADGWRVAKLGVWDGSAAPDPKDVDGDGRLELVGRDPRFLYRFGSYADSLPPPIIYELRDGHLDDASANPKYRSFFKAKIPEYRVRCQTGSAGACAGYVAVAARAGEARAAFARLDRVTLQAKGPFEVPVHCADSCASEPAKTFNRLGDAIDWFLRDLGYLPKARSSRGARP